MSKQKESIARLIKILKHWQLIEDYSIKNTTEIIKKAKNPLIHLIMEIIRQDSAMHRRAQQLIIDHFEKDRIGISPDELEQFWAMIEEHNEIEKKTIQLANEALEETTSQLAKYLLEYLITDEKKHDKLLEELEKIKNGDYPYGSFKL